jgi:hypothetical protein
MITYKIFAYLQKKPKEVQNTLFKLLHLAFESDTVENYNKFERSHLFFIVRELQILVDSLQMLKVEKAVLN